VPEFGDIAVQSMRLMRFSGAVVGALRAWATHWIRIVMLNC